MQFPCLFLCLLILIGHVCFFFSIYSNILTLTDHFEISDQNITIENYDSWFEHLNQTFPDQISTLSLKTCDLQKFLDQVL